MGEIALQNANTFDIYFGFLKKIKMITKRLLVN